MLDYALAHKDELQKLLANFDCTNDAMYFSPWSYVGSTKIEEDTWGKLQLVAIHNGDIKGYCSLGIARGTLSVDSVAVCKFCDGHEEEFAADMARIFGFLREHFRHIRWSVVAGAPTQAFYERLVANFGGRIVGRFTQDCKLRDGRLCDMIWHEVPGTLEPDGSTMIPDEWRQ